MKNDLEQNSHNYQEKNLSDIFNELNEIREVQRRNLSASKQAKLKREKLFYEKLNKNTSKTHKINMKRVSSNFQKRNKNRIFLPTIEDGKLKINSISMLLVLIVILVIILIFTNTNFVAASNKNGQDILYGSAKIENAVENNNQIKVEKIVPTKTQKIGSNNFEQPESVSVIQEMNQEIESKENDDSTNNENTIFETNENTLDVMQIINENSSIVKKQEVAIEEREVEFEVIYKENASLPKGEEQIVQPGIKGKEEVNVIRTYENDIVVDEKIVKATPLEPYIEQIVDVGTSEFLAKHNVHIGDTLYVTDNVELKESDKEQAITKSTITKSLDIKLVEVSEEWCKITFDGAEGFVKSQYLTSASTTPSIVEANRIQRIKQNVSINMALNKPSSLTLEDFKKVLSSDSRDKNKIFESNAEVFYNLEAKYNINALFVASVGVHESAWGTSKIATDKKNLFGFGAYDSSPYNSAYPFTTYQEGIELVAKSFVKYYINPAGTKIYDNETAKGTYYNGPTVSGINVRYASDTGWATKVFNTMQSFYNKL